MNTPLSLLQIRPAEADPAQLALGRPQLADLRPALPGAGAALHQPHGQHRGGPPPAPAQVPQPAAGGPTPGAEGRHEEGRGDAAEIARQTAARRHSGGERDATGGSGGGGGGGDARPRPRQNSQSDDTGEAGCDQIGSPSYPKTRLCVSQGLALSLDGAGR